MESVDIAVQMFKDGNTCSQAMLYAFAPRFGMDQQLALKVSRAFGGGMGRMAGTCGAVTGAYMVLGLQYEALDQQAKRPLFAQVQEFARRFSAMHGSIICREMLPIDISTPEGGPAFKEMGLMQSHCIGFVADAAQIVEDLLAEAQAAPANKQG